MRTGPVVVVIPTLSKQDSIGDVVRTIPGPLVDRIIGADVSLVVRTSVGERTIAVMFWSLWGELPTPPGLGSISPAGAPSWIYQGR
jgi:hypothetical protein